MPEPKIRLNDGTWLDLRGPAGAPGADGADGVPGADGADGADAFWGVWSADGPVQWIEQSGGGWQPAGLVRTVTVSFFQGTNLIAQRQVRGTLDAVTGGISVNAGTGAGTSQSVSGGGSRSVAVTVTHISSGAKVQFPLMAMRDGIQGPPGADGSGDDARLFYILPLNGTVIKNGVGSLNIELRLVEGLLDSPVTSGGVRLYEKGTGQIVGNGYSATLTAAQINSQVIIEARDDIGVIHDSISLVDVLDGGSAVVGAMDVEDGLAWIADSDGNWQPSDLVKTVSCEFYKDGQVIAQRIMEVTLNGTSGTISGTSVSTGGEATSVVFEGQGTRQLAVHVTHTASKAKVVESIFAVFDGIRGEITADEFADGIEPVMITDVPPGQSYQGASVLLYTADGKLYRWQGSGYSRAVGDDDISSISADKITTGVLNAAVTVSNIMRLASNGRLYTDNKTGLNDPDPGVFLGWDASQGKHVLAVGDGTEFIKWDGSQLLIQGNLRWNPYYVGGVWAEAAWAPTERQTYIPGQYVEKKFSIARYGSIRIQGEFRAGTTTNVLIWPRFAVYQNGALKASSFVTTSGYQSKTLTVNDVDPQYTIDVRLYTGEVSTGDPLSAWMRNVVMQMTNIEGTVQD